MGKLKRGKSLRMDEKALLRQQGFNPKYFLLLEKNVQDYEFVETQTGKVLTVRR